jgi:hypothetical protein
MNEIKLKSLILCPNNVSTFFTKKTQEGVIGASHIIWGGGRGGGQSSPPVAFSASTYKYYWYCEHKLFRLISYCLLFKLNRGRG